MPMYMFTMLYTVCRTLHFCPSSQTGEWPWCCVGIVPSATCEGGDSGEEESP